MKPKIKYINHGIACRINDFIYINKKLKKHPKLHQAILKHELEHSSGYTSKDILMDLNNKHLKGLKSQYYSFILLNPSSWIEFLPFWKYDKKLAISLTMILMWIITFCIFLGVLWILF